jgi:hypothetical protein
LGGDEIQRRQQGAEQDGGENAPSHCGQRGDEAGDHDGGEAQPPRRRPQRIAVHRRRDGIRLDLWTGHRPR